MDRTPFADISNITIGGKQSEIVDDQNESRSLGPTVDAKERKRQMDRERYAAMSVEQRNEKNRKRREARQRNKGLSMPECAIDEEDMDTNIQRLHTNQTREAVTVEITGDVQPGSAGFADNCSSIDLTYLATQNIAGPNNNISPAGNSIERKRQRDRERHATMSAEQRDEKNKKRREARQRNKGQNVTPNGSRDGDVEENMDPDDDSDWLHRNETYQASNTVTTRDLPTAERNCKDMQSKKKEKGRSRYRTRIQGEGSDCHRDVCCG